MKVRRNFITQYLALAALCLFMYLGTTGCTFRNNYSDSDEIQVDIITIDEFMEGGYGTIESLPAGADPFQDLADDGLWYDLSPFGWVWRPAVNVGNDWHPYLHGEWLFTKLGWTWLSYEPFGWATNHYGSWILDNDLGWVWVPGFEWRQHTVEWVIDGTYVFWAPEAPRGHNAVDIWDDVDNTTWIGVHKQQFAYEDIAEVAVDNRLADSGTFRPNIRRTPPTMAWIWPEGNARILRIKFGIFQIDGVEMVQIVLPRDADMEPWPPMYVVPVPLPAPPPPIRPYPTQPCTWCYVPPPRARHPIYKDDPGDNDKERPRRPKPPPIKDIGGGPDIHPPAPGQQPYKKPVVPDPPVQKPPKKGDDKPIKPPPPPEKKKEDKPIKPPPRPKRKKEDKPIKPPPKKEDKPVKPPPPPKKEKKEEAKKKDPPKKKKDDKDDNDDDDKDDDGGKS